MVFGSDEGRKAGYRGKITAPWVGHRRKLMLLFSDSCNTYNPYVDIAGESCIIKIKDKNIGRGVKIENYKGT